MKPDVVSVTESQFVVAPFTSSDLHSVFDKRQIEQHKTFNVDIQIEK